MPVCQPGSAGPAHRLLLARALLARGCGLTRARVLRLSRPEPPAATSLAWGYILGTLSLPILHSPRVPKGALVAMLEHVAVTCYLGHYVSLELSFYSISGRVGPAGELTVFQGAGKPSSSQTADVEHQRRETGRPHVYQKHPSCKQR